MGKHGDNEVHPEPRHLEAKIDRVRAIVRAYNDTPSDPSRAIRRVEDLFDDEAGVPH